MSVIREKTNILIGPGKLPEFSRKGPQGQPQPDLKALRRPPLEGLRCVEKIKNIEKLPFRLALRCSSPWYKSGVFDFFLSELMISSFSNLRETRFRTNCVLSVQFATSHRFLSCFH